MRFPWRHKADGPLRVDSFAPSARHGTSWRAECLTLQPLGLKEVSDVGRKGRGSKLDILFSYILIIQLQYSRNALSKLHVLVSLPFQYSHSAKWAAEEVALLFPVLKKWFIFPSKLAMTTRTLPRCQPACAGHLVSMLRWVWRWRRVLGSFGNHA